MNEGGRILVRMSAGKERGAAMPSSQAISAGKAWKKYQATQRVKWAEDLQVIFLAGFRAGKRAKCPHHPLCSVLRDELLASRLGLSGVGETKGKDEEQSVEEIEKYKQYWCCGCRSWHEAPMCEEAPRGKN